MMVVSIEKEPTFKADRPRLLFEGSYRYSNNGWESDYDVAPDNQPTVNVTCVR